MKCGYVALIGRPNVGKSTLMNHLLKQKISITSRKPQTTRHRILGINTLPDGQIIYVDTPGMHGDGKNALNRYLNRTADTTLQGVNVVVWLVDSLNWHDYDDIILKKIAQVDVPVILALNKIDRLKDKNTLLAFLDQARQRFNFADLVPISALKNLYLAQLENLILANLPEGDAVYPADQITDRPVRFLCAEIIREKLTRRLGEELPYALTVAIERFEEKPLITKIYALIWVEKAGQKIIVVGADGGMLKKVGTEARQDMEKLLDKKVYLQLWVKVKNSWSDNEKALHSLGFND
jgi:GTP-binding protein Era